MSSPAESDPDGAVLRVKRLGIDTHQEPIVYMRAECPVCRSEGFGSHSRVALCTDGARIIATLNVVTSDWLAMGEIGLSEAAWRLLGAAEGEPARLSHPQAIESLSDVRAKVYGHALGREAIEAIVADIAAGLYSDVHLAAFVTACAGTRMSRKEVEYLTAAMVGIGERLEWDAPLVVDKHCVGGLPGNRTTPLVVSIVSAQGLLMPKTSSRAITSPAGTADTMETLAPVALNREAMRAVVEKTGGCLVWGGAVSLSPIDDTLIRVERALDLDGEGQLIASVLSKKIAAGSSHVLIDMPVGPTVKIRSLAFAQRLSEQLVQVGEALGLTVRTLSFDALQPVGRGIGPALEALDVLAVFQNAPEAPADLRERALNLAGVILEMAGKAPSGQGGALAEETLASGLAWRQFQAICEAQGGMREPPLARHHHAVLAPRHGVVTHVNNRLLSRVAKLAGAPASPAAGVCYETRLGARVQKGEPLFSVHADSPGELEYSLEFVAAHPDMVMVNADEA
ncbi:MAG: thymidine phosphorylase family protein [Gammaproteobacteria bacterium]|nr:thymidine phosphorylase family protein [Gammaproteobacteria bacterium]